MVFVTYCIQGMTGFGGTVLALPFVVRLIDDPRKAVPVLTVLSLLFCLCFLLKDRSNLAWRKVAVMVFYLSLGAPAGVYLLKAVPPRVYGPLLGSIVVSIALWGILRSSCASLRRFAPGPLLGRAMLVVGGAVQGAFGSGGPFVLLYAESAFKDKSEFRTSLMGLWFLSNLIVAPQYLLAGMDVSGVLASAALGIPAVLLGLLVSLPLHRKLGERSFYLWLYAFLLLAGLSMLFTPWS